MLETGGRRILIHIPIAHSQEDMGSLGRHLASAQDYHRWVQARWTEIQQQVRAFTLDWSGVKVYQDGLPDAGPEIVQKILVESQSPNYDLLRWLVAQGAELIGTESPSLLKEEYGLLQAVLTAKDRATRATARRGYATRAVILLAERDGYIARRIASTLPPGGVGLLFLGQAHQVAKYLPNDILVRTMPLS